MKKQPQFIQQYRRNPNKRLFCKKTYGGCCGAVRHYGFGERNGRRNGKRAVQGGKHGIA